MNNGVPNDATLAAALIFALFAAILAVIAEKTHFFSRAVRWIQKGPVVRTALVALLFAIGPITARTKNEQMSLPRPPLLLQVEEPAPEPSIAPVTVHTNGVALRVESTNAVEITVFRTVGGTELGDWIETAAPFFVMGTQMGTNGVNALSILGTNILAATVWNVDGAPVTNGVSIADLLCTNGVLRTPASFEIRWKNTTGLDPEADTDDDGLTNWEETLVWETEAGFADTDGDGRSDGDEIAWGDDPFDADENGDGVPDGMDEEEWQANPLWAANATDGANVVVSLNAAVPQGTSATLILGDLAIPLRTPGSWSLGLVPGELYPYRLEVNGDSPVDLSIGPAESEPPMRGGMNAMSIALWVDGMGGTFDGWSLGGSGHVAIPTMDFQWDDPRDGSHEETAGGVCLHEETEAVFTPMLRPESINGEWLLDNLEERNGKLVLAVPDEGVMHYGTATLISGKLRFGMVYGAVSAHRLDAARTHPNCSWCNCYQPLDLAVSVRTPLTLKHDNQTPISIIHAYSYGYSHSNGVIEIRRKGDTDWSVLGSETALDPWTAKIAGRFELRGQADVGGGRWRTAIAECEVQFPSYYDIIGDGTVFTAMTNVWQRTKDDCTGVPNRRHELGFWIQLNTSTDSYTIGDLKVGPWMYSSTNAAIQLVPKPPDSAYWPNPTDAGAVYTVAAFHTHTPKTYLSPANVYRPVGPSGRDYTNSVNRQIVGIVYDYIGSPDPYGNPTNRLYNGHPKDDPARLYPVPPMRRLTPRLPEDTP